MIKKYLPKANIFLFLTYCEFVITPDTSILHCAVAFNKPLIGLYLGNENHNEISIWGPGPNAKKYVTILSGEIFIDVANIPAQEIIQSAKKLLYE